MKTTRLLILAAALVPLLTAPAAVVFEKTSPYNRVMVIDESGIRTLSFDGSQETRMSLADPLKGHFEYTELFHLAWLWNTNIREVLMIGLGGGSTQKAFLHAYPETTVQSVEIDPLVVAVATNFFHVPVSDRHQIQVADGFDYARRTRKSFDLIIMDAYTTTPEGSQVPPHLLSREFMQRIHDRLKPSGVVACNVIGAIRGQASDPVASLAQTLHLVFPAVYLAPARQSRNVVIFAPRTDQPGSIPELRTRGATLVSQHKISLPDFLAYLDRLQPTPRPPQSQTTPPR